MTTDKEVADYCHILIHSLRLINGYKPSNAEMKLSKIVIDRFREECSECRNREQEIKNIPVKKGIMEKIQGAMDNDNKQ